MTESSSPNYEKTLMYVGLGAAGIFMAYKVFSSLSSISSGGGGGGGGGQTCPANAQQPGTLIRLHPSRSGLGDQVAAWLQSTTGYAAFTKANPNFGSVQTLNSQGWDRTGWTFEFPNYFTVSSYDKYYFWPTIDAEIMCTYAFVPGVNGVFSPYGPSNQVTAGGSTLNYILAPNGGATYLIGCYYGSKLDTALFGKQYVSPLPNPTGVTPPNPNGATIDGKFYLVIRLGVRSWRIATGPTCTGWTLNAPSGTNVSWVF